MKSKSLQQTKLELYSETAVLIDVRESGEFADHHLDGAINIPSSAPIESFDKFRGKEIILICQTGRRASNIYSKLVENGFDNVSIVEEHISHIENGNLKRSNNGWTIDRQFRMILGVLLTIFLIGFYWLSPYFIFIPIILAIGLVITSIIDRCYMRMAIAQLPWNKGKKE